MAFKKGHRAWNKGLKGYKGGITPFQKGHITWNKGLTKENNPLMAYASQRMKDAHRRKRELNGDNSGVGGKHDRLRRQFGKQMLCDNCGTVEAKYYDWASLDHKYNSEDTGSWARLCRKCHTRYDMGKIKIKGLSITERGGQIKNTIKNLVFAQVGEANIAKRPEVRAKISKSLSKPMTQKQRDSLAKYWESLKVRMAGSNNLAKRPEVRAKISASKLFASNRGRC